MFHHYSKRALQVIFAARFKAGQRGSDALDVGDLVVALVVEDQGTMDDLIQMPEGAVVYELDSHSPLIEPEAAARLLLRLEAVLTHSVPVPTSVDLPLTAGSLAAFEFAEELRNELSHERVEPLHLMAGVLQAEPVLSNELHAVGITLDVVLAKLHERSEGQ